MSRTAILIVIIFRKGAAGLATRHELFNYILCFYFWCQIKCLEESHPFPSNTKNCIGVQLLHHAGLNFYCTVKWTSYTLQVFHSSKREKSHPGICRLKIPSSKILRDKEIYLRLYFSSSPFFNKFSLLPSVCSGEADFAWDANDYHRWGKESQDGDVVDEAITAQQKID